MSKNLFSLAAGVIALGVASSPALAANRTFVSGTGTDAGTCAITTPCRTFAYALTQTAANGEIIVLTSGGYGSVTISQGVSIINTSNFAGVTVASGNGITINAGSGDSVVLRGISLDGGGTGANGIVFNSGGALTIDQCNAQNFVGSGATGNGIILQPTSDDHSIIITNTTASHNQFAGVNYSSSGTATAGIAIDHVSANGNRDGLLFVNNSSGAASTSISNSAANGNNFRGFEFVGMIASIDSSYASGNQESAVIAISGTTLVIGRSVIMNNNIGLNNQSTIKSYQNNQIAGNGTQTSGTITPVSPQ